MGKSKLGSDGTKFYLLKVDQRFFKGFLKKVFTLLQAFNRYSVTFETIFTLIYLFTFRMTAWLSEFMKVLLHHQTLI